MYNNGNGGRNNYPPHNVCTNFSLKCANMKQNNNGTLTLNCFFLSKKRNDGTYPAPVYVGVYCDVRNGCRMPEMNFTGKAVTVCGNIVAGSYFSQKENREIPTLTIFADSVQITNFGNNGGYAQQGNYQNRGNNGYGNGYTPQNNGYQNPYPQNGGYVQQRNYQNNGYSNGYPQQNSYQNGGFQQNQPPMNPMPQAPPVNQAPPQQQMPPQVPPQNMSQNVPPPAESIDDFEEIISDGNVPF